MTQPMITRVHYYNGQGLRPLDLTDEQAYHIAMRRRHNIAGHSWGILSGLDLEVGSDGQPVVRSGLAIDGYGRELVVIIDTPVDVTFFDRRDSETLDVFLNYSTTLAPSIDTSEENFGVNAIPDREVETPTLQLEVPVPPPADRRRPSQVAPSDLAFGPDRLPPDDPARAWPVFLGQVLRKPGPTPGTKAYTVNQADRPYAGLVGADVVDPEAQVLLHLGSPADAASPRFAVRVAPPLPDDSAPGPALADTSPRLAIGGDGSISLAGKTTVAGDLTIDKGALILNDVARGGVVPPPQPWTIFQQGPPSALSGVERTHDIRIVIDPDVPDGGLIVGAFSQPQGTPKPAFQPCFAVGPDSVTVFGNLVVKGFITQNGQAVTIPDGTAATPAALAAFSAAQSSGVVGSPAISGKLDRAPFDLLAGLITDPNHHPALQTFLADKRLVSSLIDIITGADGGPAALTAAVVKGFV
jgi:hypothetical protein